MTAHLSEDRLNEYVDGSLDASAVPAVETHLATCERCRADAAALAGLVAAARGLPRSIVPDRDLWAGIESRIAAASRREPGAGHLRWRRVALALAASVVLALGVRWWASARRSPGWDYTAVRGRATIDGVAASPSGVLRPGAWIETDRADSVRLHVGEIGIVALGPGTRARLAVAGPHAQRLTLAYGALRAEITAPPRLFVVETPAAVATDLGCAYTLTVDSLGTGLLHVTSGWVELARGDHLVIVPYDAYASIDAAAGPGTPYVDGATPDLRAALDAFDAETGGAAALRAALAAAGPADAVSVMSLLTRTEGAERRTVYERLAVLAPPPAGVDRAAALALEPHAINRWWDAIRPPRLERDAGAFLKKKKRLRLTAPRAAP